MKKVLSVSTMLVIESLVIYCIIFFLWIWKKSLRPYLSPPTYPGALPLIGHGHLFLGDRRHLWKFEKKVYEYSLEKGDVVELRFGLHSAYVISDPDDCLTVANTCLDKPYIYKFGKEMYDRGLVTADAITWKPHRRLLNPTFNQQMLDMLVDEYSQQAKKLVNQLASEVNNGPFDIQPHLIDTLLTTVCRTTLGLKDEDSIVKTYAHKAEELFTLYIIRLQRVWLHLPLIFNNTSQKKKEDALIKIMKDITTEAIATRKLELKAINTLDKNDVSRAKFKLLIDHMLESAEKQNAFTDDEIREHLDTIIAAAYDTTATAVTFSLLLLGSHKDIQDRVYKEIQEVLGYQDRGWNMNDLKKLVYLDAFIKECLRLFPPAPRIARSSSLDVKLKNYTLPAGCTYVINVYGLNRHPMWGADANQFKPERWLERATLPDNPNTFASFSIGRRNCIGKLYAMMVVKTILVHILQRYRVTSDITSLELKCEVILKPINGHHISLELRK